EGPVPAVTTRAPRDLCELVRLEGAVLAAVELVRGRERDVVDVEVEAHPDRVGGHEVADLTRLIERDLGVARARRERAEHHRRAAAPRLEAGRERVDPLGAEGDRGAP